MDTQHFFLKKIKKSIDSLNKIVINLIEQYKIYPEKIDLLSILIEHNNHSEINDIISNKQIRDEVMTMLLAGHETTQISLSWTFYLLSQNDTVRKKVFDEINGVLKSSDDINIENLNKLKYLDSVINESLRLYPPVYALGRQSINEDYLDGYYIPSQKNIIFNIFGLHRNPKYWDDPNLFLPSRFENVEISKTKLPFIPFGLGHRVCIGATFAILEMKVILSIFLLHFDFKSKDSNIFPKPLLTLNTNKNIILSLTKKGKTQQ